jgi:SAM-dependent methyltransferase
VSPSAGSEAVRDAYDGLEGRLYELMMGELLHLGGLASSLELAERAGIATGTRGVDLCCGNGASMRMLVQLVEVGSMQGIDISEKQVERTTTRTLRAGLEDRIEVRQGDATETGLPEGESDFVWSEDAWCYVPEKAELVAEAIRLTRPGGTIAFTDWTLCETPLSDAERARFFSVLKFPGLWSGDDYRKALVEGGCEIVEIGDTGRFASCFELYHSMFDQQLGWDLLQLVDNDRALVGILTQQLAFIRDLGREGKVAQTRVIARRGG